MGSFVRDYVYPGDLKHLSGAIGQPATGVGPLRHTDAVDRPPSLRNSEISLHFGSTHSQYVLLPIVSK
jgi:hypothetical protein